LLQPAPGGHGPPRSSPRRPGEAPGRRRETERAGLSERAALRGALPRGQLPGQPVSVPAGPGVPSAEGRVLLPAGGPGHGHPALEQEDLLPRRDHVEGQTGELWDGLKHSCTNMQYASVSQMGVRASLGVHRRIAEQFVFLDNDIKDKRVKIIPEGNYACIYCDSFDKELGYIGKLVDYIEQNGYTICGDYICEVIAELPVFNQEKRSMPS